MHINILNIWIFFSTQKSLSNLKRLSNAVLQLLDIFLTHFLNLFSTKFTDCAWTAVSVFYCMSARINIPDFNVHKLIRVEQRLSKGCEKLSTCQNDRSRPSELSTLEHNVSNLQAVDLFLPPFLFIVWIR